MSREGDFDKFDANNPKNNQDDGERNHFFENRGGFHRSRFNNNFQDRRNNWNGNGPNFSRRPPHFNNNFGNNGFRGQRGPRPYFRRGGNDNFSNREYNNGRRYGNNPNSNFERDFSRENYNYENDEEREEKLEKERILSEFRKKYDKIIQAFKILFINESLKEEQIIDIIQSLKSNPNLTIFEAMNLIYRQVQIIKTIYLSSNKSMRQYGPNQDLLDFEFEQNLNKENLKEVIQKYKIFKSFDEIPNKEKNEEEIDFDSSKNKGNTSNPDEKEKENAMNKNWFYVDDFDRRRKLKKDEEGFFNYLPLINPEGNQDNKDEDDVYAKNENEISYHALFYKTLMCKECPILNNNNFSNKTPKEDTNQLLCPYAHDILKDFRIIYKYTDEDVCKFMILLKDSNLFSFQNYLNYIPMSLSPKFNIDTFKAHKCQLDEGICPNDYHVCPYYHKGAKIDEMRRPPLLFGYSGSTGDSCFDQRKKEYCPEKCPCGIFCRFVHSKNEFNYHQDHFRKEFDCKRKKDKNNKCVFIKTCYGKHPKKEYIEIEEEKENEEEEEKEEEKKIEEEVENDEEIMEKKKERNQILNTAKALRCRKCQNVEGDICYLMQCKHFLCLKCYKKIYKENKKEKKKLECPFCKKEIVKDTVVKVEF